MAVKTPIYHHLQYPCNYSVLICIRMVVWWQSRRQSITTYSIPVDTLRLILILRGQTLHISALFCLAFTLLARITTESLPAISRFEEVTNKGSSSGRPLRLLILYGRICYDGAFGRGICWNCCVLSMALI